jgi:hypothetical protein
MYTYLNVHVLMYMYIYVCTVYVMYMYIYYTLKNALKKLRNNLQNVSALVR